MSTTELQSLWQMAFADKARPVLFVSEVNNEDGFLPLANPKDFAVEVQTLSGQQLYAVSSNDQVALRQAQDEYLELERQINAIKNPDRTNVPLVKNPQALPDHLDFDERKEALLYNYKYDPKKYPEHKKTSDTTEQEKRDSRFEQDPFGQGGFVPNERQFRAAKAKAKDPNNVDGWTPTERNHQKLVPRMFHEQVKDQKETVTRSKTASLIGTQARAGTEDVDDQSVRGTPGPLNKVLRNTRFNGTKVPITRDVSEDPSYPPTRASTPKRKRAETPLPSIESGSPLKKMRVNTADVEAPRRRRLNQDVKVSDPQGRAETETAAEATGTYDPSAETGSVVDEQDSFNNSVTTQSSPRATPPRRRRRQTRRGKPRERVGPATRADAVQEDRGLNRYNGRDDSMTNDGLSPTITVARDYINTEPDRHHHQSLNLPPRAPNNLNPTSAVQPTRHSQDPVTKIKLSSQVPIWARMTAEEKLHHKWDSESLVAAIKDDYTWLPEATDAEKRVERDRLLLQKNPHRSFSIKNKWRFWKAEGLDKRPRKNKAISNLDGAFHGDDTKSTPGLPNERDQETSLGNQSSARFRTTSPGSGVHDVRGRPGVDDSFTSSAWDSADPYDNVRRSGRSKR